MRTGNQRTNTASTSDTQQPGQAQNNNNNNTISVINLQVPALNDYIQRHKIALYNEASVRAEIKAHETKLCKILNNKHQIWHSIPHSWLDGTKLLTLGDLYTNNGELTVYHGDEQQCELCNCNIAGSHPTLHRATRCTAPTLARAQSQIEEIVSKYENNNIAEAIENRRDCQRILRLLAECALNPTGGLSRH